MDYTLRPGERIIRYFTPPTIRNTSCPGFMTAPPGGSFRKRLRPTKSKRATVPEVRRIPAYGERDALNIVRLVLRIQCCYRYAVSVCDHRRRVHLGCETPGFSGSFTVETSTDFGQTWTLSARLTGPYEGPWRVEPATIAKSKNGTLNAVSGSYGYQVRFTSSQATITNLLLATEFQLNPRSIPQVTPGQNEFHFRSGTSQRTELPIRVDQYQRFAKSTMNTEKVTDHGQSFIRNQAHGPATVIF